MGALSAPVQAAREHADGGTRIGHRLVDLVADVQRGHRHVGRGQHLGHGDHVGLEVEHLRAERLAEPPEAGDHLVGDQQDVVLLQDGLDPGEVAGRRHHHAAGALHRLRDEGGHRLRPLALDGVFQFLRQPVDELRLGFSGQAELIEVRAAHAHYVRHGQVEVLVHHRQPRQRRSGQRHPVVTLVAGDDLLLERPTARVVVVANQLEGGVVRLRPGVGSTRAIGTGAHSISFSTRAATGPGTLPENEW